MLYYQHNPAAAYLKVPQVVRALSLLFAALISRYGSGNLETQTSAVLVVISVLKSAMMAVTVGPHTKIIF